MRTRIVLSATVAALALVAAGCGGSDSDEDPTAAWASDFCTTITDWTGEIQNVLSQFSDPSNLSADGLQSAAEDARSATEQFVDDVESLGAPETDSGEEVQSALSSLSSTVQAQSAQIDETVNGVSNLTDVPSAITEVTTSLSAMGAALSAALTTIQDADVSGELQNALEDSPDCADISS